MEQFTFSIIEALLPLSYYNINENNNTIVISNNSRTNANGAYIITKGNYAVTDLFDVLLNTTSTNSQVCATSGGIQFGSYFTVSFDTYFWNLLFNHMHQQMVHQLQLHYYLHQQLHQDY